MTTTTAAEHRITVEQVRAGQTVRFTGGHTRTIADVRMTAEHVYLQPVDDDGAPYALPVGSTVYVLDEPTAPAEQCTAPDMSAIRVIAQHIPQPDGQGGQFLARLEPERDRAEQGRAAEIVETLRGMQYRTDAVALLDELAALLAAR